MRGRGVWVRAGAFAFAALLLAGCATGRYDVRVSALRDPTLVGRTYWLLPGEGLDAQQLEYRSFEAMAYKALRARGYQPVDRSTEPHLVIYFDYGIGAPAGANVRLNTFRTGAVVHTAYTTWVRLSAVEGKKAAGSADAREVWTTTAATDVVGRDLHALVPVLLASAMDLFGQDAPRGRRIMVPFGSRRVAWLREVAP